MSRPIPLADPDGTVYSYACGRCHHVHAGASFTVPHDSKMVAKIAETYRESAERCCRCQRCRNEYKHELGEMHCRSCRPAAEAERAERDAKFRADDEARAALVADDLTHARNKHAALHLRDVMSGISEKYYCAGWLDGLEYSLWSMVEGGSRRFGFGEVTEAEVEQLHTLANAAGGWWYWWDGDNPPTTRCGERFVTLEKWAEEYAKHG